MIDIVNSLQDQFQRFRVIYFNEFDDFQDLQSSHREIYDAISTHNKPNAKEHAEEHIHLVKDSVMRWKNDETE